MADFHKIANNILKKFGFPVGVTNYTNGDFNPSTGSIERTIESTSEGIGAFSKVKSGEFKDYKYVYQVGDNILLLNIPVTFDLNVGTTIEIDGTKYKISLIQEVKDVLTTALYKLVIREDFTDG